MNKSNWVVGVDVGGSHITAGLVDLNNKRVRENAIVRRQVDCHAPADEILTVWCDVILEVARKENILNLAVGFAMPGPFNYAEGICLIEGFDKYESLFNINIRSELTRRLKATPQNILFRNDAEAYLEGELFCGAAVAFKDVIGITLGTGLGSAYSHNGITCDAELSVTMYQGKIIEEFVSTRGLLQCYARLSGKSLCNAKEIAERYNTEIYAQKAFQHFADNLSWFLQFFIEKENPQAVIIGGNIAASWNRFMPRVLENLEQEMISIPIIKQASLGENAALIGGACCFLSPTLVNI